MPLYALDAPSALLQQIRHPTCLPAWTVHGGLTLWMLWGLGQRAALAEPLKGEE